MKHPELGKPQPAKIDLSKYFTTEQQKIDQVNALRADLRRPNTNIHQRKQMEYEYGRCLAHGYGCLVDFDKAYVHLARSILFNPVCNQLAYQEMAFILHKQWCKTNKADCWDNMMYFLAVSAGEMSPDELAKRTDHFNFLRTEKIMKQLEGQKPPNKITWTGSAVPEAQALYATFLLQGRTGSTGASEDMESKAEELLIKSVRMNNPLGWLNLGIYKIERGIGEECEEFTNDIMNFYKPEHRDKILAYTDDVFAANVRKMSGQSCIEKSASLGMPHAKYVLWQITGRENSKLLEDAANAGDVQAIIELGKQRAAALEKKE